MRDRWSAALVALDSCGQLRDLRAERMHALHDDACVEREVTGQILAATSLWIRGKEGPASLPPVDFELLARLAAEHGIEVLGPPERCPRTRLLRGGEDAR